MADIYEVKIDLQKLAANLTAAGKKTISAADADQWLKENDWLEIGLGMYTVEAISLGIITVDEIVSRKLVV